MKKNFLLLCVLVLMFGISSITVFAKENPNTNINILQTEMLNKISTRATSQGLWYQENYEFKNTNVYNAPVTPEKGAALNVWIKNDKEVSVQVYETNFFGGYSKVYERIFPAGEKDVRVKDSCNGKKYLVQINQRNNSNTKISLLVYQN